MSKCLNNTAARTGTAIAVAILAAAFALPGEAQGGDLPTDWRSIRAAGMGDSFTAVAVDETGPFYNPAGIGRVRNPRSRKLVHLFSFPGLMVGGNKLALQAIDIALTSDTAVPAKTTEIASEGQDWFKSERFGRIMTKAIDNPGQPLYAELQLFPVVVMGNRRQQTYLVGLTARSEFTLGVIDSADTTKAYINSRTTTGGIIAIADSSRGGTLSYGLAVRPGYRYSYENYEYPTGQASFSTFRKTVQRDASKTTGLPVDAGLLMIIPDQWLPSLGLAVRNIPTGCVNNYKNPVSGKSYTVCGSKRAGGKSTATDTASPDSIDPTEIRAGVSITPRFKVGKTKANFRLTVDGYPIPVKIAGKSYGFTDLNVNEIIHGGGEFFFGNALGAQNFALRAGIHGKNMSWGATIVAFGVELEYASYPGYSLIPGSTERKDRRHLIGLSSRW